MLRLQSLSAASPDALAAGMGPGVLEIKCPFNRGQPESASVPSLPPWYYMPQVWLDRKERIFMARASMALPLQWPAACHIARAMPPWRHCHTQQWEATTEYRA